MNQNLKSVRLGSASQASAPLFPNNVSRQIGTIRAVSLEGNSLTESAVRESIEQTFGKIEHKDQLEIDRKSYETRDNVIGAMSQRTNTMK